VRVKIDLGKSLQENASAYFEASKKARKKLLGLNRAIVETKKKVSNIDAKAKKTETTEPLKKRKREWFEKFHWFFSSDGVLVIGGRDAKSNEEIMKKYSEQGNLYFHADIHGAPHVIAKCENNSAPEKTKTEAAVFAAVFSKAWHSGVSSIDVYSVKPAQVSKTAPSGEAMGTGAFMVRGTREWHRKTPIRFAIGVKTEKGKDIIISGPPSAIKEQALIFVVVGQGRETKGFAAKKIKSIFEKKLGRKVSAELDEIISLLPAGGCEVRDKP